MFGPIDPMNSHNIGPMLDPRYDPLYVSYLRLVFEIYYRKIFGYCTS